MGFNRRKFIQATGVALGAIVAVTLTQSHLMTGGIANAAPADTYRELLVRFPDDTVAQRLLARLAEP